MGGDDNGSVRSGGKLERDERKARPKARDLSGSSSGAEDDANRRKTGAVSVSESEADSESQFDGGSRRNRISGKEKRKPSGKSRSRRDDQDDASPTDSDYSSESEYSDSEESLSEEEGEKRKRKRKEKKKKEREEERERKKRRKEKLKKRRKREKEEERERRRKRKEKRREKKKEKRERGKKGAVTDTWGKYGIIRETDMWNKRPEFTAWLAEVKQVNLESLPAWEEKKMFKEFMEDHNTATFPSKKYYNIDAYHKRQIEKQMKKGFKRVVESERTVFNDEEQRRLELRQEREKQKQEEVEALKDSMRSGMAQAMREQALLREEMAYLYKIGKFEAAAAIQKRLDPDAAM